MRRILIEITHISQYVVNIIIFLRLMKKSCDFNKIIRGIMTRQLVIIFFSFKEGSLESSALCVFRFTSKEKHNIKSVLETLYM